MHALLDRFRHTITPTARLLAALGSLSICLGVLTCQHPHSRHNSISGSGASLQVNYQPYWDTTVVVYGSYRAVKLPITKGVAIANPICLALGPGGIIYAANATGEVYSLRDTDQDGIEDQALLYCNVKDFNLRSPAGLAYQGDTLYVGTAQQIRAFVDQDHDGKADTSWVFFEQIPHSEHPYEWTSGLRVGPDGWLYVALSTDSWNAGASPDPNGYRGAILRIAPGSKRAERLATGIRSVHGMDFSARGDLFFTDNEGGGNPKEELNVFRRGAFYGHNPKKYPTDSLTPPVLALQTEVAPSGIVFNKTGSDFGGRQGDLFVAFYGPGERWTRGGIGRVTIERQPNGQYSCQEFTLADIAKLSDIAFGRDGSLYAAQHGKADYWYNVVYKNEGAFYKLVYDSSLPARQISRPLAKTFSTNSLQAGKQLFGERGCLGCHTVDGVSERLGPNLQQVGKRLTRQEILEEIQTPSRRIQPGMMGMRVVKKDGQVLLGRVVSASTSHLSLMLVGNHIVELDRTQIARTEPEKNSLMYQGLLNGLSQSQQEALLDYLISLRE